MDLIWILVVIALIGIAVGALLQIPMLPPPFKVLMIAVAVLFIVLWVLRSIPNVPNVMP